MKSPTDAVLAKLVQCQSALHLTLAARAGHAHGRDREGERGVTADTALRLARFLGTSPEFLVNLQATRDLTKTRLEHGRLIERDVQPRAA